MPRDLERIEAAIAHRLHSATKILAALLCLAMVWSFAFPANAQTSPDATQVNEWLDQVLENRVQDPQAGLKLALGAAAAVEVLGQSDARLEARACMAVAVGYYLAESPAAALSHTTDCFAALPDDLDSTSRLRIESFRASMMVANGDAEAGLKQFDAIMARDHSQTDPEAYLRMRTNYGTTLQETGRVLAATEVYQSVLQEAIATNSGTLALATGNNLMILLIEQQMFEAAQMWQQRVMPFIDDESNPYIVSSVKLHSLQLQSVMGDPAGAAAAIEKYLQEHEQAPDIIKGSAYEILADAYRAAGMLDQSYAAAVKGVEYLHTNPIELPDARLALVRTLLEQKKHQLALVELAEIQKQQSLPPRILEHVHALTTRALLGLDNADETLAQFNEYVKAGRRRAVSRAQQDIAYFDAQRTTREQQEKIQQFERDQRVLRAEAEASEARASGARKARNLWIAFFLVLTLAVGLLMHLFERRVFMRRLARQQDELNKQLKREVAQKSEALMATMSEQAELEKAIAEKEHTQTLGVLTGNVAHDFNNLMQVVRIANEHLRRAVSTPLERSMLDGSNSALDHAKDLIQQLLAYASRQSLKIEPTNFSHYIEKTSALFSAAVGERINLRVDDQSAGASAIVDASLLTTALLNLLSNSIDAMDGTGTITMSAAVSNVDNERQGKWAQLDDGEYLMLTVEDSGHGMAPEVLARASEPFFRGSDDGRGSGLGLSSVQGFARQSGGDIRIESVPGFMTRVVIMIPATSAAVLPSPDDAVLQDDLDNLSVLLVEDNMALSRTLQAMLRQLSARVEHVASADAALVRMENGETFDVVLSDIRMHGKHDGFALFREVRERWPALPVLLMTGHNEGAKIDGATVLNKPFSQTELVENLRRLTGKSESTVDG